MKRLKRTYNRMLFKKYGFDRGSAFEKIPIIYKLFPLWSPSLYGLFEGAELADGFAEGMEAALRESEDEECPI